MKRLWYIGIISLWVLSLAALAHAEELVETWRSPIGQNNRSVSVNPTDGSCWVTTGQEVCHFAADGTILLRLNGFQYPEVVSVNPTDGSCWVAYERSGMYGDSFWTQHRFIAHFAVDGTELWQGEVISSGPGNGNTFSSLSVNPTDGSCWIAGGSKVIHVAADGTELWRGVGAASVSVYPTDGSCWVVGGGNIIHLAADGTELWRGSGYAEPSSVSVNTTDGSCWVSLSNENAVIHLAADGTELWRGGFLQEPAAISVNSTDGSCWVVDTENNNIVHLAEDGTELRRRITPPLLNSSSHLSVNAADGSVWLGTQYAIQHLAGADGSVLWMGTARYPFGMNMGDSMVAAGSPDGGCWINSAELDPYYDINWYVVSRVTQEGTETLRLHGTDFGSVGVILAGPTSANPNDGSAWVIPNSSGQLIRLASDGSVLWDSGVSAFCCPVGVSVNAADDTSWVADSMGPDIAHVATDGSDLWRGGTAVLHNPLSIATNPTDGSCWVEDIGAEYWDVKVLHFAEDGTLLWQGSDYGGPLAVDPTDGSCWVTSSNQLVHLAANGTELFSISGLGYMVFSVDPVDGSLWMAYAERGASERRGILHMRSDGVELSHSYRCAGPVSVDPADGSCWVADFLHGQIVRLVPVVEPGAAFGISLISSDPDAAMPRCNGLSQEGPLEVHFYDLSTDHPTSWLWDFGDGTTSTEQNPVHTYTKAGHFDVSLSVVTDLGPDTETKEKYLTVHFGGYSVDEVCPLHGAYNEVMACVDAGIVQGYPDGTYRPANILNRGQMAVYIARALAEGDEFVPPGPATATFIDIPTDSSYFKYVEYAVDQGVVQGYSDNTYRPTVTLNRGQMAIFIARSLCGGEAFVPVGPETPTFPDVATTDQWYNHVEYIADPAQAIAGGYSDGTYRPLTLCRRDQMAVYVARAFLAVP